MTADQAFKQGNRLAAEGRWREAEQAFDQCLRLNAQDWQALANRANARLRQGDSARALDDYWPPPRSIRSRSISNAIWRCCSRNWANWNWRKRCCARPWRRSPNMSTPGAIWAWCCSTGCDTRTPSLPSARHRAGRSQPGALQQPGYACTCALLLDDAIAVLQGGLELDPNDANLRFSLSIALLLAGRYAEAWPYYEARWEAILQPRHRERRWQGQALDASVLLLWAEQGLGDSLQMARFLPRLRAEHPRARLLLACPKTFHRLFAQFDGIELLAEAAPAFDWQLPLMSLPGALGVTLENLSGQPYLSAVPAVAVPRATAAVHASAWWESGQWGVGKADHWRRHKSVPPEDFASLCRRRHRLRVLAAGNDAFGLARFVEHTGPERFCRYRRLGGGAGSGDHRRYRRRPPGRGDGQAGLGADARGSAPFFLAAGERAPWYDSMRVWRQAEAGAWDAVLEGVAQALAQRLPPLCKADFHQRAAAR